MVSVCSASSRKSPLAELTIKMQRIPSCRKRKRAGRRDPLRGMAQTVDGAQQSFESYWLIQDHIDRRRLRFSRLNERPKTGQQDYRDIGPGLLDQTGHLIAIHP